MVSAMEVTPQMLEMKDTLVRMGIAETDIFFRQNGESEVVVLAELSREVVLAIASKNSFNRLYSDGSGGTVLVCTSSANEV